MAPKLSSFLLIALCFARLQAAQPWDEPFSSNIQAILLEAAQAPAEEDDPAIILLEDWRFAIDKQGRAVTTMRRVYRVRQKEAVDLWSSVEWAYQPWYEQKPSIRARVLSPGGGQHWLDEKTIADSPVRQFDSTIYSDRRLVRAPLPAVAEGAVVETEVTVEEKAPPLASGVARRIPINNFVPVRRFHALVEAHKSIPLRTAAGLIPATAIQRETTGKGVRVEVELGPLETRDGYVFDLPSDVPRQPYFAFSTGQSWQALAQEYEALVETALAGADLSAFLSGVDLAGSPRAVAARLAAKLHEEVRYTGVEFAESEIVPGPPAQTLQRKYGDCKDKSVLLIAMLRAAGIDAHAVLLSAGAETDVDRDLPGIGMFNHVIVHAATEPPLWIDATAEATPVGVLPIADQGRLALIADAGTAELVTTPVSTAEDNRLSIVHHIRLAESGRGTVEEAVTAHGSFASEYRSLAGPKNDELERKFERLAKAGYRGAELVDYRPVDPDPLETAASFEVHVRNVESAATGINEAAAGVNARVAFQKLPFTLSQTFWAKDEDEEDQDPRDVDLVFAQPHSIELRYFVHPPPMFKAANVPGPIDLEAGPARYSRSFQIRPDGVVEGTYRFHSGKRRWTPRDVAAFKAAFEGVDTQAVDVVTFAPVTQDLLANGRFQQALELMHQQVERNPDSSGARARYSRVLLSAGLGGPALVEARRAVDADPASFSAWRALAWAHQHDVLGRRFGRDWKRLEAETALRKALELNPKDIETKIELAAVVEHNNHGVQYGPGADLAEAAELYDEIAKRVPLPQNQSILISALLRAGKADEARRKLQEIDALSTSPATILLTAHLDGQEAGLSRAQTVYSDSAQRSQTLAALAYGLVRLRNYPAAAAFMKAAARLSPSAETQAAAGAFAKLRRYEDALAEPGQPTRPAQEYILSLHSLGPAAGRRPDSAAEREEARVFRAAADRNLAGLRIAGFTAETSADMLFSMFRVFENGPKVIVDGETVSEGEDDGPYSYQVGPLPTLFVARDEDDYRLLASSANLAPVGRHILDLLEAGDVEGAKAWVKKVHASAGKFPGEPGIPAIQSLASWVLDDTTDPDMIRPAAASLLGRYSASEEAVEILIAARERVDNSTDRSQVDVALCEAYASLQRWPELLEVSKRLLESNLFKGEGLYYALRATLAGQMWSELETIARSRIEANADDKQAMEAMAVAKTGQGDYAAATEWLDKVQPQSYELGSHAKLSVWLALIAGQASAEHLDKLQSTDLQNRLGSTEMQYTLAALQAALGNPEDAVHAFRIAVGGVASDELDAKAWVVYAKICELYGFPAEAAAAFERARSTPARDEMDWWALALL